MKKPFPSPFHSNNVVVSSDPLSSAVLAAVTVQLPNRLIVGGNYLWRNRPRRCWTLSIQLVQLSLSNSLSNLAYNALLSIVNDSQRIVVIF